MSDRVPAKPPAMPNTSIEVYNRIFGADIEPIWRASPFASQIPDMCHARAVLACTRSNHASVRASRQMVYEYMSDFKRQDARSPINLMYRQIPTYSGPVRKYLNAVCQLYTKSGPARSFGVGGDQDETWLPIYESARVNKKFQQVHRIVRATNVAAVRPIVVNGVPHLTVYRRDQFRVLCSGIDPTVPVEMWYPIVKNGRLCLVRMTAETISYLDPTNTRRRLFEDEENTWGELQFAFVRLEDSEDDFFGPLDHDLLESRLEANSLRFRANLAIAFETSAVAIGHNLGDPDEDGEYTIGPGALFVSNSDGGGAEGDAADASITFEKPDSEYRGVDELRQDRQAEGLRDRSLPASSIDQMGEVPSGVARVAERADLIEARSEDASAMIAAERQLKRLFGLAINEAPISIDGKVVTGVPVDTLVSVTYPRERILQAPADDFTLDTLQADRYILSPVDLYRRWAPDGASMSDADIIDRLLKNKALTNQLTPPSADAAGASQSSR